MIQIFRALSLSPGTAKISSVVFSLIGRRSGTFPSGVNAEQISYSALLGFYFLLEIWSVIGGKR